MEIWAHTLVKNEGRYLWFAVASIIDRVDKVLLWDTGSTDTTPEIMRALKSRFPGKISIKTLGEVDINEFTATHQQMLEETKADWVLLLDGDEVWWDGVIAEFTDEIKKRGKSLDSLGCRYYNLVGDIYHYQDESKGKYRIDAMYGHLTIRAFSTSIPGVHFGRPHGQIGIFNGDEVLVQNMNAKRRFVLDKKTYLHFTHLPRASSAMADKEVPKRAKKLKYELGYTFPLDFYYPEVFFKVHPSIVPSPWETVDRKYQLQAGFETPLKFAKRKLVRHGSGY